MNHCFLLDGKTILPIDHNHQLFLSLKKLNNIENKYCPCYQHSSNEKLGATNNNKHDQINEKEDHCSCSLQSIEKISEDKHHKFTIAKRNTCKHHQFDQQINNNETYLINRMIPSINFTIDSTQINNNQSNKSPSTITIIIKPFIPSENYQKDISSDKKSSLKKRKNSSSSLRSPPKRISTCLSDQTVTKHRLSTFKDITRSILPIPTTININETRSSNILNSRTLLNIYRNKKQY